MKLLPRQFRGKLLVTMVLLVLFVELTTVSAVLRTTYRDTISQAHARLLAGVEVLERTLRARRAQLLERVEVTAADFGFRAAVATHDPATIASVLANQGRRAGADRVLMLSPDGQLQVGAATADDVAVLRGLLKQAERNGRASRMAVMENAAYQFVMVPVNAPELIGWLVMGFELDRELADALSSIAGLSVMFSVQEGGTERFRVSTLAGLEQWRFPDDRFSLQGDGRALPGIATDDGIIAAGVRLNEDPDTGDARIYGAVLVQQAKVLSAYHELRVELLLIFGATLIFSVVAAIGLSRAIGRPLMQLVVFARTIGGGETAAAPRITDHGELGLLADTLESMQEAIRAREARIVYQSSHDQLTGLPNREAAEQYLARQIVLRRRCLIFRTALRGFKEINESLGYAFGDQILKAAALWIRAAADANDRVFRVGGNEFLSVIQCDGAGSCDNRREQVFRQRIERPVELLESPITLRLDLGVLTLPEQADTVEQVLRRSAIALDRSGSASGRTALYEDGEDETHLRELTLTRDLQQSLAAGQMRLMYQPQLTMAPARPVQFEALLRWHHPQLGVVPPDEFILLAERSGQVSMLTDWVIEEALGHIR